MTPEEAGEEILAGKPYDTCNKCHGKGERAVEAIKQVKGRSIPAYISTKCSFCFGKGFITRQAYLEAAQLLGIRIPPQPKPHAWRKR